MQQYIMRTTIEKRMGTLEGKMGTLEGKMGGLEGRMGKMEVKMDKMDNRFEQVDRRFGRIEQLIEDLAISVKNGFDQMVTKEHFDFVIAGIDRRFDIIENISIRGHERRIEILEDKVGVINNKIGLK